ncbi:MAG: type II secretion system protein [Campylobacterota bacterium]
MRSAFTMIELIFAIVILAVVMLTIPLMIQVNNKALEGSAAQEAIFLVSAVLSETTTRVWDTNSIVGDDAGYSISKILDIGLPGTGGYTRTAVDSSVRVGGLDEDLHRSFVDYNATDPLTSPDLGDGLTETLPHDITDSVSDIEGYKSSFTITATRQYVNDTSLAPTFVFATSAPGAQSNMKMTEVVITAPNIDPALPDDEIVRLRAYTCNIGEIDYAKRRF